MNNIDFSFMDLYGSDLSDSTSGKCCELKDESYKDFYQGQNFTCEHPDNVQMKEDNPYNNSFQENSEIIFDEYNDKRESLLNIPKPTQNNGYLEDYQVVPLRNEDYSCSSYLFPSEEEEVNIYIPESKLDNTTDVVNQVKCGFCREYIKKSNCFIMKNDRNTYICINCAIGKKMKKEELEDWEEHHSKHDYPRLKRCNRCMKYKNKCRFKDKVKYCSYCSLKKKLSYLKNRTN